MAMSERIELAAEVVAAYVSNNPLPKADLPDLILAVHSSLTRLGKDSVELQVEVKPPAVPVRKSITPDFLICLEDGKKFGLCAVIWGRSVLRQNSIARNGSCLPTIPWSRPTTRPTDRLWRESSGWVRNGRLVDSLLHSCCFAMLLCASRIFDSGQRVTLLKRKERRLRPRLGGLRYRWPPRRPLLHP